MKTEWRKMTLKDCVVINESTYSPKEAWPFINYLDTGNITDNRISDIQHLVNGIDKIPTRARRKCQPGDIVYSTVRPNQRHYGLIKEIPENFLASTGFAVVRGKSGVADTDFIYWFLAQDHIVTYLHSIAETSTTAYPSIRPADLEQLPLSLPPLDEQRSIAHILGTLDDKIDLNRRMNETLEEMARALFTSWFVHYDPVHAKIDGRWRRGESLPGLPADLYDLFPSQMTESELGEIPDGWEIRPLGDLCHKPQYGYTASARDEPVGPKFLRITDINKNAWVDWGTVPCCDITDKDLAKYRLYKDDFLIARMADPGHGVLIEDDREAVFASYLIRFRPKYTGHARLLQYWARSDRYWEYVRGRGIGTTRVSLNAKVLSEFPIIVPSSPLLLVFAEQVEGFRNRGRAGIEESTTLAALRDALLPKLVSGEVRVEGCA